MKQYTSVTFITGNLAKVKWLQWHLDMPIEHKKINVPEIQSLDLREVVEFKAKEAYKLVNHPVLVEDTSLVFSALGKLPGPLIKWFLEELGNEGLCRLLDSFPDRSAIARVMYGFYDGEQLHTFSAEKKGIIAAHPKGANGHGWDAAFIPDGSTRTWGEMEEHEQHDTSLRGLAIPKLKLFLKGF
jgi:non-canonical purine NTP pyrophosphatase (RdgB/HAM1 family)